MEDLRREHWAIVGLPPIRSQVIMKWHIPGDCSQIDSRPATAAYTGVLIYCHGLVVVGLEELAQR
jgi:hypothetical protein